MPIFHVNFCSACGSAHEEAVNLDEAIRIAKEKTEDFGYADITIPGEDTGQTPLIRMHRQLDGYIRQSTNN